MQKKIFLVLLSVVFIACSCATFLTGFSSAKPQTAIASTSNTGPHKDYISISDGFNGISGMQWFSGMFLDTTDAGFNSNYGKLKLEYQNNPEKLQEDVKQYDWWYFRGTNCLRTLVFMLELEISFKGIAFHMTQDINISTTGIFQDKHKTIGTEANPFNGIFDGNGYKINIDRPVEPNEDGYVGIFGAISNAVIMNLTVTSPSAIAPPHSNPFKDSVGTTTRMGVFAASATDDSIIINCINEVDLDGLIDTDYGAVIGKAVNTQIINCVDKADYDDVDGKVFGNISGPRSKVSNSANYIEWNKLNPADQITYIKEMNSNMLYFLRNHGKHSARYFWGIYSDKPLFNAISTLLLFDENFLLVELIVQSSLANIEYNYIDTCNFMDEDPIIVSPDTWTMLVGIIKYYLHSDIYIARYFSVLEDNARETVFALAWQNALAINRLSETNVYEWDALSTITNLYNLVLSEIDKLIVARDNDEYSLYSFSLAITSLADTTRDIFNELYWTWALITDLEDAIEYEDMLMTFAKNTLRYLYDDTRDFMEGAAQIHMTYLDQMYAGYLERLDTLKMILEDDIIVSQTEFLRNVLEILDEAVEEFDGYYWDWFVNIRLLGFRQERAVEMIEAYNYKLELIPAGSYREKLERAKAEALAIISEAEFADWLSFAEELYTAVAEAQVTFEVIYSEYLESKNGSVGNLVYWIIGGGVFVIAGLAVFVALLLRRNKRLVAIAYGTTTRRLDKKDQMLSERAQAIEKETQLKREQAEEIARIQRERAMQLNAAVQLRKDKREEESRYELEKYEKARAEKEKQKENELLKMLAKDGKKTEPNE